VAGPARRQGVATLLMDAAEQLARDRAMTMDDDLIIWLTKDLVS